MRNLVRVISVIAMVIGFGILAYVAYLFFWPNGDSQEAAAREVAGLEQTWNHPSPSAHHQAREYPKDLQSGEAFAIMRIPRLGADWQQPLVEGVSLPALAKGVGHFRETAMPGQVGNFSVAGHRCCASTHGEPFADLDTIQAGDKVYVETKTHIYVYEMHDWFLVKPDQTHVVNPVPWNPEATPRKARITLVTCNPYWGSTERLITHGVLIKEIDK